MLKNWIKLSRPEFHTVGIFPLLLGASLGYSRSGTFNVLDTLLALLSVVLIMLSTYWSGEVYDYEVDKLSASMERNRFSGGTQVLQTTNVSRKTVFKASLVSLALAGMLGIYFLLKYGMLLFALGVVGAFMGFFYTTPPFRWAYRGIGEVFIAIAYGWLPVAVGYYINSLSWNIKDILIFGTPVALSIFLVILINEFPDYPADREVGKRNLVVRLGRESASWLYVSVAMLFVASITIPLFYGYKAFAYALLVLPLTFWNIYDMIARNWMDRSILEKLCARTIVLNLSTTLLLTLGIWITMR